MSGPVATPADSANGARTPYPEAARNLLRETLFRVAGTVPPGPRP